jgi:hypothetical protein
MASHFHYDLHIFTHTFPQIMSGLLLGLTHFLSFVTRPNLSNLMSFTATRLTSIPRSIQNLMMTNLATHR